MFTLKVLVETAYSFTQVRRKRAVSDEQVGKNTHFVPGLPHMLSCSS